MKKSIVIACMSLLANTCFAQKSAVTDAFNRHQIDENVLNPDLKQRPDDLAFDGRYTVITSEKKSVMMVKYDPSKPEDDRWTVLSVNGNPPTAADSKTFKKEHKKQAAAATKINDASYKIEQEDANYLVVSYKLDPASLPEESSFLKDCRNHLTINLKTKRLEKLQSLNEKKVKIKMLNAEKLDLVIKYTYNELFKRYLPDSEDLNLTIKFLGQPVPMETISEYWNYTRK